MVDMLATSISNFSGFVSSLSFSGGGVNVFVKYIKMTDMMLTHGLEQRKKTDIPSFSGEKEPAGIAARSHEGSGSKIYIFIYLSNLETFIENA
ncbi:MAG: hypothetical protein EOM70_07100 [Clostridia bacterium]|nr:hypothetical protein [Clostridia bacterium]